MLLAFWGVFIFTCIPGIRVQGSQGPDAVIFTPNPSYMLVGSNFSKKCKFRKGQNMSIIVSGPHYPGQTVASAGFTLTSIESIEKLDGQDVKMTTMKIEKIGVQLTDPHVFTCLHDEYALYIYLYIIEITTESANLTVGQPSTIKWKQEENKVFGEPNSVQWLKYGVDDVMDIEIDFFKYRLKGGTGSTVTINNAFPSDAGRYVCQLTYPGDQSYLFDAYIYYQPVFYTHASNLSYYNPSFAFPTNGSEEEIITMNVTIDDGIDVMPNPYGWPLPYYEWYKDGIAFGPDDDIHIINTYKGSHLSIYELFAEHTGLYVCNASNEYGTSQITYTIYVERTMSLNALQVRVVNADLVIGSELRLICEWDKNTFVSGNVEWLKDGISFSKVPELKKRIAFDRSNTHAIFTNAILEDAGIYICKVFLFTDTRAFKPVYKEVSINTGPYWSDHGLESELTTTPTSSIELFCTANGHPIPHIRWLFSGKELRESSRNKITNNENGSFLVIEDDGLLYIEDSGVYTCEASNALGKIERTFDVTILNAISGIMCASFGPCQIFLRIGVAVVIVVVVCVVIVKRVRGKVPTMVGQD